MVKVRAQSNYLLKGYGQKTSKNQLFPKITNFWSFFGHNLFMTKATTDILCPDPILHGDHVMGCGGLAGVNHPQEQILE